MIALYIILLHLCLDHLRDLWYTLAWSLGGGGTTWSRVLVLINKSGAYKASLEKKTLAGHQDFYLKVTVTIEGGQSFPNDELQLNFTDQQIQPSQVYLQMIPSDASLDSVIIHSFKMILREEYILSSSFFSS